jgi:hypothetical protein
MSLRPQGLCTWKKRLLVRREAVTIAAGFRFNEGVLICADSKLSGNRQHYESKLITKHHPCGITSVFSISGRVRFARMAIAECQRKIDSMLNPSKHEVLSAIEAVLIDMHQKHVHPHPDRNFSGGPAFTLLFALSLIGSRTELFVTDETAIDEVLTYDCIGTGEYLGHYIIGPRYRGATVGLERTIFTALTALERIKRYDPDCGGYSDFIVLYDSGATQEKSRFDIQTGEQFSQVFYETVNVIYEDLSMHPPDSLRPEESREILERLLKVIDSKRQELEIGHSRLEQLHAILTKQSTGQRLANQL